MTRLYTSRNIKPGGKQYLLAIAALCFMFMAGLAHAEHYSITVLSPSEGQIYKRFNEHFSKQLKRLAHENNISVNINWAGKITAEQHNTLLVTVGSVAANQYIHSNNSSPVIHSLLTSQSLENSYGTSRADYWDVVLSDFDPGFFLMLIRHAMPDARKVGIVVGDLDKETTSAMEQVASGLGLELVQTNISHERELASALDSILQDIDVFLAIPDKMVHNRRTARSILLTTYKQRVPVVAYSASYVNAGALTGLFTTPESIAAETAQSVINHLKNEKPGQCHEQNTLSIKFNKHVGRLLEIDPTPTGITREALLEKIERCKQ